MEWVEDFYAKQNEWLGVYKGDVIASHRHNAAVLQRLSGRTDGRVLELGAGGGQNAAATVDLGYTVTAVELVPSAVQEAQQLLTPARQNNLRIIEGDFYKLEFDAPFDIVCYWDGFGIGTDAEQQRLLKRIAGWLRPDGCALIEIYGPAYWAQAAGRQTNFGQVSRRYSFDTEKRRMLDNWWPNGREEQMVTQSLRCYDPDELQALLHETGLTLTALESRGAYDAAQNRFLLDVPIKQAMSYLAKLTNSL
ncbi:MAG: class I SAM-dependent methyltransferase [Anaerolineales bacterium]|nr:class I SAM-dependent methyltransferase [Anaerolineales bacterium]